MSEEYISGNCNENGLTETQMKNIYIDLSCSDSEDFEHNECMDCINNIIQELYDKNFLLIDSDVLQKNVVLINNKFLELIKVYYEKNNKIYGLVFIGFCDYFSLDYNKTFCLLHPKLKLLIEAHFEKMIGSKRYNNMKREQRTQNGIYIPSIFNLLNTPKK